VHFSAPIAVVLLALSAMQTDAQTYADPQSRDIDRQQPQERELFYAALVGSTSNAGNN
jgi:hypothetical protein